jgi:hypothetical protein
MRWGVTLAGDLVLGYADLISHLADGFQSSVAITPVALEVNNFAAGLNSDGPNVNWACWPLAPFALTARLTSSFP